MAFGLSLSCAAGEDDETGCAIGSEGCACTNGGACDAPLVCLSDLCVDPNSSPGGGGSGSGGNPSTGGNGTGAQGGGTGAFNAGGGGGGECALGGCKAIDVLFALDGSGSMAEEINALSVNDSFTAIIDALAAINCGDIDYRIGVTDDNDGGFKVPSGWTGADPWFDSTSMTKEEIAAAFKGAADQVVAGSGTDVGCEHVLTSSRDLLNGDATGFLRPEALLVLIMVTDVDDYGAYDQANGNDCGIGCPVTPPYTPNAMYETFVALKGGEPKGVAAIVVAGDPNVAGGTNFCGQPGTCCSGGIDCLVFHADRLWAFAGMQNGANGYTANLCAGAQTVPTAVETAFTSNIDLACEEFEPPM
ncbi:MAG: VWA domain-containing protein [Polyangiaceae bacterium]|nr:VWA domain-containing protein [Polyangiaceae bacterium]